MNRFFHYIFSIATLSLLLSCGNPPNDNGSFKTIEGKTQHFEALKGQWVFINYWAEWCKPCLEEFPELTAFHKEDNNALVLGINFDRFNAEQQMALKEKYDIGFTLIMGKPTQYFDYPMPTALPTTVVINPEGKVVKTLMGPQTQESLLKAMQ